MTSGDKPNRILLIGWDAADWKVIDPLLDAGKMPALESMINHGVMGNLATIRPVLSPMLWTSIATGKRAYKHGIHGFTEPTPDGTAIQPITNLSRNVKAFWNIFNQNGMRGHVVGWWPTSPAEPINGVMVSNHFSRMKSTDPDDPWPMMPGTVHPPEMSAELAELRFHPAWLDERQVRPFIPHAEEVDQEVDSRMGICMKMIAECTSIQAAATHLLETHTWDYAAVYFDAIDHFCHGFMKYHPPRQEFIAERDFKLYSNVVEAGYRYHDMMLATLLKMAGEDATVMLISDHGFHPDHMRLKSMPNEPAAPAAEHRDLGIIVIKGPGFRQDERIYGASLLDICPTLLTVAGLPVGSDMDGNPLVQAWEKPPQVKRIPSWEQVPGDTGQHPPDTKLDPRASQQAIQQLVELGYIDQPAEDVHQAIEHTVDELNFNLAQAYMDADRHAEAVEFLAKLYERDPTDTRVGMRLIFCYQALERIEEMKPLLETVKEHRIEKIKNSATSLSELIEDLCKRPEKRNAECSDDDKKEAPQPPSPKTVIEPAELTAAMAAADQLATILKDEESTDEQRAAARHELASKRQEVFEKAVSRATDKEKQRIQFLLRNSQDNPYSFDYLDGYVLLAEGKVEKALECFMRAEKAEPNRPWLPIQIGEAYQQLNHWEDAERNFLRAIELDPENAQAYSGLARSYLGLSRNQDAAEAALTAVGLLHHLPYAHFLLGTALHRLGKIERAVEALQMAVNINPNFAGAHARLAMLYDRHLDDPEKAALHRQSAKQARAKSTTQVMPRSVLGIAASAEQKESLWQGIADWIPNRPALQPGLDLSQVITIVTGLPRSGTSMLMQMLDAGGVPPLKDGERVADEDNPRGYLELERVRKLRTDSSWLPEAKGKAIKVIAQLLPTLPKNRYRIIYVDRDLDEIVKSQRTMLDRSGKKGGALPDEQLKDAFAKQVRAIGEMLENSNLPVVKVQHRQCLEEPAAVAAELNQFLGGQLNESAMAAAVDANLYRQRMPNK